MNSVSRKKSRKVFLMIVVVFITTVVLVVETYAWFVGISTVNVSEFQVSVTTSGGLEISLDGEHWKSGEGTNDKLVVSQSTITATTGTGDHSYTGNTNKWPSAGLVPISSPGTLDTAVSRLKFYQKSSLASSAGGYRIVADRVDNYTVTNNVLVDEADGYAVFDLFIRNGVGNEYISSSDESIYMLPNPTATVYGTTNYGAANSLRVGFYTLGVMKAKNANIDTVRNIKCTSPPTGVTAKCTDYRMVTWNIWEPNDNRHTDGLVTYYNSICKTRTDADTYSSNSCSLTSTTSKPVYAINDTIQSSDKVDIYDGSAINGYTASVTNGLLKTYTSYKDSVANSDGANRESLIKVPGNSITKVRIYIWLEGQDIDNYDVITKNQNVKIAFGLTKDRYGLRTASSTS